VKEDSPIAKKYHEKSIAEQNSVDLAWDLLMKDEYKELRRTIYKTEREFRRFRYLVVNTVLATGKSRFCESVPLVIVRRRSIDDLSFAHISLLLSLHRYTDIMDKDLKQLRNNRWDKAFKEDNSGESDRDKINRKATIGMSILNFLLCSELQIISPSHTTISFFIIILRSHRALDSGVRCGPYNAALAYLPQMERPFV
jgi:3'5'-cyclic nucleotide phosphodiesterase